MPTDFREKLRDGFITYAKNHGLTVKRKENTGFAYYFLSIQDSTKEVLFVTADIIDPENVLWITANDWVYHITVDKKDVDEFVKSVFTEIQTTGKLSECLDCTP